MNSLNAPPLKIHSILVDLLQTLEYEGGSVHLLPRQLPHIYLASERLPLAAN